MFLNCVIQSVILDESENDMDINFFDKSSVTEIVSDKDSNFTNVVSIKSDIVTESDSEISFPADVTI